MRYRIENETGKHLRIRLLSGKISNSEAEVLQYALLSSKVISEATVFRATGGVALPYTCGRDEILGRLERFQFANVERFAEDMEAGIGLEEVQRRKLTPELKRKLRTRMLIEMAADVVMPMHVQLAYHAYQLVTLRDI